MQYNCQIASATYSGRPSLLRTERATSIGLRSTTTMANRPWSSTGSHAGKSRLIRGSFSTRGRPAASAARLDSICSTWGRHSSAWPSIGSRPGGRSHAPSSSARKLSFSAFTSARSKNPLGLSSAASSRSPSWPAKKPALARYPATALVPLRCIPSITTPAIGPAAGCAKGPVDGTGI